MSSLSDANRTIQDFPATGTYILNGHTVDFADFHVQIMMAISKTL